jgi:hypothetical protein
MRYFRWLFVLVILGGMALVACTEERDDIEVNGEPAAAEPTPPEEYPGPVEADQEQRDRARAVGAHLTDADDTPLLTVDDYTVSHREFAHELGAAEYTLATMNETLANGPNDGEVSADQEAFLADWVDIIESVGLESVAMGSIIAETAAYQWAVAEGFSASEEDVVAAIEEQRRLQDELADTQAHELQQAFIDAVGEDRYWNEILPQIMEREIVLAAARRAVITGEQNATAVDESAWLELQVELVRAVEIEILDPETVDQETVEQGREYIVEDYAALQRQRDAWRNPS